MALTKNLYLFQFFVSQVNPSLAVSNLFFDPGSILQLFNITSHR